MENNSNKERTENVVTNSDKKEGTYWINLLRQTNFL